MASPHSGHIVGDMRELWGLLTGWLDAQGVGPERSGVPAMAGQAVQPSRMALMVDVTVGALPGGDVNGPAADDAATLRLVLPLPPALSPVAGPPGPLRAGLYVGDVVLDVSSRTVRRGGAPVDLTGVEFELLFALLAQAGSPVARDDLSRHALGRPCDPADRSVDMHVSKLRRKLGPRRGGGARITTVRGVGYVYTVGEAAVVAR